MAEALTDAHIGPSIGSKRADCEEEEKYLDPHGNFAGCHGIVSLPEQKADDDVAAHVYARSKAVQTDSRYPHVRVVEPPKGSLANCFAPCRVCSSDSVVQAEADAFQLGHDASEHGHSSLCTIFKLF